MPWYAKALAGCVAAYALSPIDLIPDFIPVLGYLDDLIIVPLGILLVVWLMPPAIMAEHRATAAACARQPRSMGGADRHHRDLDRAVRAVCLAGVSRPVGDELRHHRRRLDLQPRLRLDQAAHLDQRHGREVRPITSR